MILQETKNKDFVTVKAEDIKEVSFLEKFPGLLSERNSPVFYLPAKHNVAYNIYTRLIAKKQKLRYTPFVKSLVEERPQLLELPEGFEFYTQPLSHQRLALRYAYTYKNFGLLLEPGLGKTKVVLDYLWLERFKLSLVVCPKALLFVWEEECAKHRPEIVPYVFKTTDFDVEWAEARRVGATLLVINYDKAVRLKEGLAGLPVEFCALDEGLIKDHTTERTKALTELSRGIPGRAIMSGTLVNNSPLDVFAPTRFMEPSLTSLSVTKFKERYCVMAPKNKNILIGFKDVPEIRSILEACSIVMTKAEWLKDLPRKVFHQVRVQLSDEQRRVYYELMRNYTVQLDNGEWLEVDIPLTAVAKLAQISSGFVYYRQEDDAELFSDEPPAKTVGPRETYYFKDQPKIGALLRLVGPGGQVHGRRAIIWFNMTAERVLVEEALTRAGYKFVVVAGGEKAIGKKVQAFNSDNSIAFFLAQAQSVNYGVTVLGHDKDDFKVEAELTTTVSDQIFYSLGYSLERYLQQQDRIHRIGQTQECNYWNLISNTPIDEKVVAALEDKLSVSQEMLVDCIRDKRVCVV